MDEGLLDSKEAMVTFLNLIASEPDIARVPIMIDQLQVEVIEAGLQCVQARHRQLDLLKEGEEAFLKQARLIRRYGAAVVVMAFDETGQADTAERKVDICTRAYDSGDRRSASRPRTSSSTPTSSPSPPASRNTTTTASTFIEAPA